VNADTEETKEIVKQPSESKNKKGGVRGSLNPERLVKKGQVWIRFIRFKHRMVVLKRRVKRVEKDKGEKVCRLRHHWTDFSGRLKEEKRSLGVAGKKTPHGASVFKAKRPPVS